MALRKFRVKNEGRRSVHRGAYSFAPGFDDEIIVQDGFRVREITAASNLTVEEVEMSDDERNELEGGNTVMFPSNENDEGDGEDRPGEADHTKTESIEGAAPAESDHVKNQLRATAHAEKLARELGVDLSEVESSRDDGLITKSDVEAHAQEGDDSQENADQQSHDEPDSGDPNPEQDNQEPSNEQPTYDGTEGEAEAQRKRHPRI